MERCEVCGLAYHRLIRVEQDGREHLFDCFQCATAAMAPSCGHRGAKVIGHGMSRGIPLCVRQVPRAPKRALAPTV
ncbi:MAG: hypothetical protein FJ086_01105 [Deltaproteobacteria bacterium]|nr:hypothetical protein [Deltaproteobacteria bacterium]